MPKTITHSPQYISYLESFVENTSEVNILTEDDFSVLFSNNSFLKAMGLQAHEIEDKLLNDYFHPQFKEEILKDVSSLKTEEYLSEYTVVFRNKAHKRVYLQGDVRLINLDQNKKIYSFILRDITQRKRAETAQNLYFAIAQSNLTSLNLKDFLRQVHQNLQKNIYANNFFVAVYNSKENSIEFPYHIDEYYETGKDYIKRNLGNGLVEYAILKKEPLIFNKKELEELIEKENLFIYEAVLPEIQMLVPLKISDKVTGVIGIKSYTDENKFSSIDMELLEFVSGQIAMTMERKQAEDGLQLQTGRLKALFNSSSHLLWTVNQKRQLSSLNKNYNDIVFNETGEAPRLNASIERYGWKLYRPEDKPYIREMYNRAFEGKPQYFEANWGKKNGGDLWYEFHLNPIISKENGEVEEVSGIGRDITENKKALLNLQKSENKFRNIIESFIDIYYRSDLAGNITMISPSVFKHTGYTEEEVINQKVDKFFENVQDSSQNIKLLLRNGNITNFEIKLRRKDGEIRQFMLNIRMIKNERGIPVEVEGVARDVTDLLRTAEEIRVAKEEAEHSLKVKEQFLANMSHEIRTPMNGIIGMIDLLSETSLDETQKDYINTIRNSSETLLTILNDILDLSKLEAGKMNLEHKPFDLKETVRNLTTLFMQKAVETNNSLQYDWDNDLSNYIVGDQIRLMQILSNLASNAIKFTQNGSVTIKAELLNRQNGQQKIKFSVIDTGIGIAPENQKKLFNSFQQLDISTKKAFGGTGLGLAISKELSGLMGGNIGLESKLGAGSTFWFTITAPTADKKEIEQITKPENEISLENYFKDFSPKVLLVDDNMINRKVGMEILKKANCIVIEASSGERALELYRDTQDFDVILMDIQMPEMDGIETTQLLREEYGDKLPNVVAMTAYSMQNDKERFLNSGFDNYLPKPIRAQSLIQKVEECIGKHQKVKITSENGANIDVPAFDNEVVNSLKEMVGDETVLAVFQDFQIEAGEQIKNVGEAYKTKDVDTIQKELHTLKGNSGTLGLMRIYEITKEIEEPSKTGNLDHFEDRFDILKDEYDYFVKHYQDYCRKI